MTDYTRPRYRIDSAGLRHFAGYESGTIQLQDSRYRYDQDSGSYVYDSGTRRRHAANVPDPELELYTAVTGRRVYASYTHAAWRNEYAVTGQSVAMERMLALVTETTHCDALDGPVTPVPAVRQHRLSELQLLLLGMLTGLVTGLVAFIVGVLIIAIIA